ncbi:MMPL family transporter [Canibacter zhoujuaniae]|uniref:MMPL family transporter n=1 Tax=Canibacter zhoujuaniae TaxID=2708343 RepID=UPI0014222BA1|nr:MMPL family transporter [Canibacter zhoujuaniae]
MAKFLYKLGRFAAQKAWAVILIWTVVLAAGVGSFFAFSGTLTNAVNIPETETEKVADQIAAEIPEAAGGSAVVVLKAKSEFTADQRADLAALFSEVSDLPGVDRVVDPFATEADLMQQREQVTAGEAQIADGRTQLNAGEQQLTAAETELKAGRDQAAAGRSQLEGAIAQLQAAGIDPQANPQIAAQTAQLEAAEEQLKAGEEQLNSSRAELEARKAELQAAEEKLTLGKQLLDYAADARVISDSGTTALVNVVLEKQFYELLDTERDGIVSAFENGVPDGVDVHFSQQLAQTVPELIGVGEIVGLAVAIIVLLVLMRAVLPAVIPVLSAIVGVGVGVTASLSLSGSIEMMSVTPVLGIMLGLAVGIDYSLFIINRHRKQLAQRVPLLESIGLANGTSGNAVVFAGITVIIALLALGTTGIPFLGLMGYVAAGCVAIAVLVSITLTPALLGLIGMRVISRADRRKAAAGQFRDEKPVREMSRGRAIASVLLPVVGLGLIGLPALGMKLGLPTGISEPAETTQHKAYVAIAEEFGEGANAPLIVVANHKPLNESDFADAEAIVLKNQAETAGKLADHDAVVAVAPIANNIKTGTYAFQVLPSGDQDADTTRALVSELRDEGYGVAGNASAAIDVSNKLQAALPVYLALVVGFSLIVLILVFRSILVPLIATAGFVLSLLATLGAMTAIYQKGFLAQVFAVDHPSAIIAFLPIIVIGILFGLAMDYQLFIASGMREAYVHGTPARLAVQKGLRLGRSVVIAAALIMMSVFGGFIFSATTMIRAVGFGLAFGVLVDAFVVRLVLMPALVHLVGSKAWWLPKWLDRLLPNLDVEGETLNRQHTDAQMLENTHKSAVN